jgi:hypothetical protein
VADQTATGTIQETGAHGLEVFQHPTHHGRSSSWTAVGIIVVGFVVGGAAMLTSPEPTWWLFWVGTGIVVVGGILALSTRIMDDWY